jgi:hypothetical protein
MNTAAKKIKSVNKSANRSKLVSLIEKSIFAKIFLPKGINYKKTKENFNKIGLTVSVEMVAFYKFLLLFLSFVLMITIYSYVLKVQRSEKIYGVNLSSSMIGFSAGVSNTNKGIDQTILIKLVEKEPKYNSLVNKGNFKEIYTLIKTIESDLMIEDTDDKIAKIVINKLLEVNAIRPSYRTIILIFLSSIILSNLVNFYIWLKMVYLDSKIDEEINLLQMLTFILIKNSNVSVREIIKKQRDYSNILKPYYNNCLKIFSTDDIGAIEYLKKEINNSEYSKFMLLIQNNLITDRETNIRLIESNKNLRNKLVDERNKRKDDRKALALTIICLPMIFLAYILLFAPLLYYAKEAILQ